MAEESIYPTSPPTKVGSGIASDACENVPSGMELSHPRPRRAGRRWMVLLGLLGIVFLGLLPRFIGSHWIVDPLLARALKGDFRATVGSVSLGWFSPLSISNIDIVEQQQQSLIHIERVQSHKSLVPLLMDHRRLGAIDLESPTVNLTLLDQGTNLQKLLATFKPADLPEKKPAEPLRANFQIVVQGLRFVVRDGNNLKPLLDTPIGDFTVEYVAVDNAPVVQVAAGTLLDHAPLTPELFDYGLQFVLPIVSNAAAVEGSISLATQNISVPLSNPKDLVGGGRLTIHEVAMGVRSPLILKISEFAATVFRRPMPNRVVLADESNIDFLIDQQQVWHEGVRFGLPEIDPDLVFATSGTVGFDHRLELVLEIPLPVHWLANRAEIKELGIKPLHIPIRGTLEEPIIAWSETGAELSTLLSDIQRRLGDSAPLRSAILGEASELAEGKGDAIETAAAALEMWQKFRQSREDREPSLPLENSTESTKTLRERLKDKLFGQP